MIKLRQLQNILLLIIAATQFIMLVTCYQPIMNYKFHFVVIAELNSTQDIQNNTSLTHAKIKVISNPDLKQYNQNFAKDIKLQLPPTVLLSFYDRPQNIKHEIKDLLSTNEVKNLSYNNTLLNEIQNICYIVQQVLNAISWFIIIALLTILFYVNIQYEKDDLIASLKNIIIESVIAILLATALSIFFIIKLNILLQIHNPDYKIIINYVSLALYDLAFIILSTLISLISFKFFNHNGKI